MPKEQKSYPRPHQPGTTNTGYKTPTYSSGNNAKESDRNRGTAASKAQESYKAPGKEK